MIGMFRLVLCIRSDFRCIPHVAALMRLGNFRPNIRPPTRRHPYKRIPLTTSVHKHRPSPRHLKKISTSLAFTPAFHDTLHLLSSDNKRTLSTLNSSHLIVFSRSSSYSSTSLGRKLVKHLRLPVTNSSRMNCDLSLALTFCSNYPAKESPNLPQTKERPCQTRKRLLFQSKHAYRYVPLGRRWCAR